MRTPIFAAAILSAWALLLGTVSVANSQPASSCPYENGLPATSSCGINSNPDPAPTNIGGASITTAECISARSPPLQALFSYDDASCHAANASISVGADKLLFVKDATDILPDNYKRTTSSNDFRSALYCDTATKTLILAFRGSVTLTPLLNQNEIYDWYFTNFLQHLGDRPT